MAFEKVDTERERECVLAQKMRCTFAGEGEASTAAIGVVDYETGALLSRPPSPPTWPRPGGPARPGCVAAARNITCGSLARSLALSRRQTAYGSAQRHDLATAGAHRKSSGCCKGGRLAGWLLAALAAPARRDKHSRFT